MIPIVEFVLGIAVLVFSAEKLIGYLVGVASRWAVSLFLVAVIFTGIEFDDLAYGIVLNVDELRHAALGTVLGTTIAMTGLVLALSAIIAPCRVDVPKDYLALFVLAPVVTFAFAFTGSLTKVTGVILVLLFVAFVGWIGYREYSARRPIFRNAELYEQLEKVGVTPGAEPIAAFADGSSDSAVDTLTAPAPDVGPDQPGSSDDSGQPPRDGFGGFHLPDDLRVDQGFLKARRHNPWVSLSLAVIALVGLVIGAIVAGEGTDGILDTFNIDGTVFGVTIATLALSLEDLFLTVEPSRRGAPEIGVANVIGSVVFSLTGKLGIVLLVGGTITIGANVLSWHLPALLLLTVLSALFLASGRMRRWHGVVLLVVYIAYFVTSLMLYGNVPVDD